MAVRGRGGAEMDVINDALGIVAETLNRAMQMVTRRPDACVIIASPLDGQGKPDEALRNKIVMALYHIEVGKPTAESLSGGRAKVANGLPVVTLHVALLSNYAAQAYVSGLDELGRAMGILSHYPSLDHRNTPTLSPRIERVAIDRLGLTPAEGGAILALLGITYRPSQCYRLRVKMSAGAQGPAEPMPAPE